MRAALDLVPVLTWNISDILVVTNRSWDNSFWICKNKGFVRSANLHKPRGPVETKQIRNAFWSRVHRISARDHLSEPFWWNTRLCCKPHSPSVAELTLSTARMDVFNYDLLDIFCGMLGRVSMASPRRALGYAIAAPYVFAPLHRQQITLCRSTHVGQLLLNDGQG